MPYGESSEYNFDKFSGKDLDEELDTEQGLNEISSEDLAADFKQAISKISPKLPSDFIRTLEAVVNNIEFYYDAKKEDAWQSDVFEPLNDVLDKLDMANADEIEEDEDEFVDELSTILRASTELKKSKVN